MSVIEAKWIECHTPFVLGFSVVQRLPRTNLGILEGKGMEGARMSPRLFLDVPINTFSREISNPSHSWWLLRATSLFVAGLLRVVFNLCLSR